MISEQPTPPEPGFIVAFTLIPAHTELMFGVFAIRLGAVNEATTVHLATFHSLIQVPSGETFRVLICMISTPGVVVVMLEPGV